MSFASDIVADLATARREIGTTVTLGGRSVNALNRSTRPDEGQYVPQGATNAEAADVRVFAVAPADFPQSAQSLTWNGAVYQILAAIPTQIAGVAVETRIFAFRRAPLNSTTTETAGEPEPGVRKPYLPPDSTV